MDMHLWSNTDKLIRSVKFTGVTNDGFLLNALKTLFKLSRILLDL